MTWELRHGDCLEVMKALPADSVNLVFGSPPYEAARSYGIGFNLRGQAWVDWMVGVYRQASRVCVGLVAFVVEGQTRGYRYSATPALLMADLHRAGFHLRRPAFYHRVGIPGSGGPDWLRNDYEFVVCVARPGKLPWADPTACGHKPKRDPGGEVSYRTLDGTRVNERRSGIRVTTQGGTSRNGGAGDARTIRRKVVFPEKANPGNVIRCTVGGGLLGHPLAHENEAPFPLQLAEFFVRSFAAPGSLVLDPFSGSATTGHACLLWGRDYLGIDVRESQVNLARRRLESVTPTMFPEG